MTISLILISSAALLAANSIFGLDSSVIDKAKETLNSGKETLNKATALKETLTNGDMSMDKAKTALEGAGV